MHKIKNPNGPINVTLVGCGGTGSQVLTGLARLHRALLALGHRYGLSVSIYDADTISESNVGRQLFYPQDVGKNKAVVLVSRVNAAFGTEWDGLPQRFDQTSAIKTEYSATTIIVGCVDTRASRREIHEFCKENSVDYWLDLGNAAGDGQIVLGEPLRKGNKDWHMRLPTIVELFSNVLDESIPDDDTPSCSLAEALEKQELFINQGVATHALQLLWTMFRRGQIDHSAIFVNMNTGRINPLPINREAWLRFGHRTHRKPPTRKAEKTV